MKTLKELKQEITTPKAGENTPFHVLKASGEVHLEYRDENAVITAYKNGFLTYEAFDRGTAFPITGSEEFRYCSENGDVLMTAGELEEQDWTIWATLQGSMQIEKRRKKKRSEAELLCLSDKCDEDLMSGGAHRTGSTERELEDRIIEEIWFEDLLTGCTEKQKDVMRREYLLGQDRDQIMEETGQSRNTVRMLERRGNKRILKKFSKNLR